MNDEIKKEFLEFFEASFPKELSEKYIVLECIGVKETSDTLLLRERSSGRKCVAKCYTKGHPLFDYTIPDVFQTMEYDGVPKFIEEICTDEMRCEIREYLEGITLEEYRQTHSFSEEDILSVGIQICKILCYLHSRTPAIIHRDIKPQNVIWREDKSVALIDFGIARTYKENEQRDTVFSGTKKFAPPEQYGFKQTDERSDIYSLGILLTWMKTGKAEAVLHPKTKLEKILAKSTAFSPDSRYQKASLLQVDLNKLTDSSKSHKGIIVTAAIGSLLVLFVAVQAVWQRAKPEAVAFEEPLIEQAVRIMLDKPDGKIKKADLSEMREIYIVADQIFTNQDAFYEMAWNQKDPWQIRGPIESIEDLKMMPNLQEVCIGSEHITDITPLKDLKALKKIEFCFNDISDLDALSNKLLLKEVGLNYNPLTDISSLASCPGVNTLDTRDAGGDFSGEVLEQMGDFDFIDMCNDSDMWRYLEGKTIRFLKMGNNMSDLEVIRGVAHIEELDISWSTIHDISALSGRSDLLTLVMPGCNIVDLEPLFTLPNLQSVTVSSSTKAKIEQIDSSPPFDVVCE